MRPPLLLTKLIFEPAPPKIVATDAVLPTMVGPPAAPMNSSSDELLPKIMSPPALQIVAAPVPDETVELGASPATRLPALPNTTSLLP